MKETVSRTNALREVGYCRVSEIAKRLKQDRRRISKTIKLLGLTPFENYFYDEYQIQLIRDYR